MKVIYLLAALLLSAAVVILLGLSPQRITDDIMSLLHRDGSLKYKVLVTQGKIKKSRMQRMIEASCEINLAVEPEFEEISVSHMGF